MGAQFALHCLPDAGVVGKRKSHAADGGGGPQRGQDQAGYREELDRAGSQLAQRIGIRAQLAAGEYRQFEAAARSWFG
ncbi:hypothetical protein G6F68_021215 [Rhizopus microsporus]|nr:hypothetical protein G6F68_021215 [Rhizopus microsporus]